MIKIPGESRREWLLPIFKEAGKKIQETGTTRFGSSIIILKKFIRQNLRLAR
jgi:hypothetical protein